MWLSRLPLSLCQLLKARQGEPLIEYPLFLFDYPFSEGDAGIITVTESPFFSRVTYIRVLSANATVVFLRVGKPGSVRR